MIRLIHDFFSPVLSDRKIKKMAASGQLFETPLYDEQFQPNSVDLTLAPSWKSIIPNDELNGNAVINPTKVLKYCEGEMVIPPPYNGVVGFILPGNRKAYCVQPKEFVLLASKEVLNIPNGIVAFVQGRSSIARMGIQTEQAGLIDAGFRGTITFEVYNETDYPIYLLEGMRVAQVYFFKAMSSARTYGRWLSSKYSGQIEATGSRIHLDPEVR